jgi:hypothetical protein
MDRQSSDQGWQRYTLLTDLEAVFRSLKSDLGLRPVFHSKEERAEGHLFFVGLSNGSSIKAALKSAWRLSELVWATEEIFCAAARYGNF